MTSKTASQLASMPASRLLPARVERLAGRARELAESSHAKNTRRAYASDWRAWATWAKANGAEPLPASPGAIAIYLAELVEAGLRASTIRRRATAIGSTHRLAGFDSPTRDPNVGRVLSGIARELGTAPRGRAPILVEDLRRLSAALPDSLLGIRDRAVLLVTFAGALRRSELVALDLGDLGDVAEGLEVTIRRSKTDQTGAGTVLGLPRGLDPLTCPVAAWRAWRIAGELEAGPAFRPLSRWGRIGSARLSDRAVARIVQRAAALAGIPGERLAAHSLRAGLVTSAALAGVEERDIARQSRHRSVAVLRSYVRIADRFRDNAAGRVGL